MNVPNKPAPKTLADLAAEVERLAQEVAQLRRELLMTRDISRACACFGTDDGT